MHVNDEMLKMAIKKAVEAGLLPKHPSPWEEEMNRKIMRGIIEAAVEGTAASERQENSKPYT